LNPCEANILAFLPGTAMKRATINIFGDHGHDLARSMPSSASLAVLLASGGDKRIWLDPATGRNRYGTLTRPADAEISFSSSTASNPREQAFDAAHEALSQLLSSSPTVSIDRWFDHVHGSIAKAFSCPSAQTILAASGTDAELLSLGIISALSARPLTNIFVAPDETGNGVPQAAAGRHFAQETALGCAVDPGTEIVGLPSERIEARAIAIRDQVGKPRPESDIDADMIAGVESELRRGRDVIVHVLDTSKTGLTGVSRRAARYAAGLAPGRVWVVIDACQLRCPLEQLCADISDGFIVLVTASKFFAAPPFAGAILLPSALAAALGKARFPAGLLNYSAAQDWSRGLRNSTDIAFEAEMNLGLGLRWIAGLDNIEKFKAISEDLGRSIREAFLGLVRLRAQNGQGYYIHEDDEGPHLASRGILPMTVPTRDGSALMWARTLQARLREPDGGVCHVGQPVPVGHRAVLRVSLSAAHMIDVSQRVMSGQQLSRALIPLENDLDRFFSKWDSIQRKSQDDDAA
jgi:hypothetical protein